MTGKRTTHLFKTLTSICAIIGVGILLLHSLAPVFAQASEILWSSPQNVSNTPDFTSTDPFLLADPAGYAHLFWAERVLVCTRRPAGYAHVFTMGRENLDETY